MYAYAHGSLCGCVKYFVYMCVNQTPYFCTNHSITLFSLTSVVTSPLGCHSNGAAVCAEQTSASSTSPSPVEENEHQGDHHVLHTIVRNFYAQSEQKRT